MSVADVERESREGGEEGERPGWVIQPGSSVVTQLCEEEFRFKKHVALLCVQGKRYRVKKIPLQTVRDALIPLPTFGNSNPGNSYLLYSFTLILSMVHIIRTARSLFVLIAIY